MTWHDQFRLPDAAYLMSHSVGCLPVGAEARASQAFFDVWANQAGDAWGDWLPSVAHFGDRLANLLGGKAEEYCPQSNLSAGLTKILQSLPEAEKGLAVLACESDFPSMGFVRDHATSPNIQVRQLPKDADVADPNVWESAIAEGINVAFITHVHYLSGIRTPVREIVDRCRERGVITIVDVAQSAGVVPFSVTEWGADFVIGSCVKWLCGGPGAGYLWATAETAERCHPKDVGWFSHADPFEFRIDHFEYAPGVARFWGGTPSVVPYVIASAGLEQLAEIGLESVADHNRRLSGRLIEAVGEDRLMCPANADHRGGTVMFRSEDPQRAVAALREAGVRCDARGQCLRMSAHIYNTEEDVARAAEVLRSVD